MTAFASLPAERLKLLRRASSSAIIDVAATKTRGCSPRSPRRRRICSSSGGTSGIASPRASSPDDGGAIAARALARGLATLWRRGTQHAGDRGAAARAPRDGALRARRARSTSRAAGSRSSRSPTSSTAPSAIRSISSSGSRTSCASPRSTTTRRPTRARRASPSRSRRRSTRRAASRSARDGSASAPPRSTRSKAARARSRFASGGRSSRRARPAIRSRSRTSKRRGRSIARAPAEILDLVEGAAAGRERRRCDADLPLEVLAIRLGGYALDACGEDVRSRPRSRPDRARHVPLAAQARGSRRRLARAPAAAQGRAQHALLAPRRHHARHRARRGRRRALARPVRGVVGARHRSTGDAAAARDRAADDGRGRARAVLRAGRGASHGGLVGRGRRTSGARRRREALDALHADDTELAHALAGLARALEAFARRAGHKPNLEAMCLELVLAGDRLHGALADPVKALHAAERGASPTTRSRAAPTENAPRVAALVARAIRARELVDARRVVRVARAGRLGAARGRGARRDPPHAAAAAAAEEEGAQAHRGLRAREAARRRRNRLGVARAQAGRRSLLRPQDPEGRRARRTPPTPSAQGILASFVEEAKALAGLYHPERRQHHRSRRLRRGAVPGARVPDRRRSQAVLGGAAA